MSTLSSASSISDQIAAYKDNASYREDADATKAAAFITACTMLLMERPERQAVEGQLLQYADIRQEKKDAQAWLAANGGGLGGTVRHVSFANFRT